MLNVNFPTFLIMRFVSSFSFIPFTLYVRVARYVILKCSVFSDVSFCLYSNFQGVSDFLQLCETVGSFARETKAFERGKVFPMSMSKMSRSDRFRNKSQRDFLPQMSARNCFAIKWGFQVSNEYKYHVLLYNSVQITPLKNGCLKMCRSYGKIPLNNVTQNAIRGTHKKFQPNCLKKDRVTVFQSLGLSQ